MGCQLLLLFGVEAAERKGDAHLVSLPGLTAAGKVQPKASAFTRGLMALASKDYPAALELFENATTGAPIKTTPICWLTAQYQVCNTLNLLGKKVEAIDRAGQMVAASERNLGAEDPVTCEALSHLAFLLKLNGRLAEAEPVYARNLACLVGKYGTDSFFAASARTRLADLLMLMGRMEEAEHHHRKALAAAQAALGLEHADNCFFLTHLAYCLHVGQKKPEAAELMNKAFSIVKADSTIAPRHQISILRRQAEFFRDTKELDKARMTGRLCLERLAARNEAHSSRVFYYDRVKDLYHSILTADGLKPHEIKSHLAEVETRARADR